MMHIEELKEGDSESVEKQVCSDPYNGAVVVWEPKRLLVGAGARALFYPTLLYNVVRNKIQSEFRWWDRVDEHVLLGAVPFPTDVPRLKALGVGGVVTLNEPYETLVPTSLYHDHGIEHLLIPTRDYLLLHHMETYAKLSNLSVAMHFVAKLHMFTVRLAEDAALLLCSVIWSKYKQMTPDSAYKYVRSIRPRVLLASSQRLAVQDYYHRLKKPEAGTRLVNFSKRPLGLPAKVDLEDFDDNSLVLITESDLDGYEENPESGVAGQSMLAETNLACRVQFASQAAISRLSCLWFRCHTGQKVSRKKLSSSGRITLGVDIHVY